MRADRRFQLYIHPAGAAAAAAALLFCPAHAVLAGLVSLVLHELGHMAAMYASGVHECRFELTPFGAMADIRSFEKLKPFQQAVSAAGGPLISLLGAWICFASKAQSPFFNALFTGQLSLGLVNCLPAWPMDGARILVALCECFGQGNGMRRLLCRVAQLIGIALTVLGLWGAWYGIYNLSLLLAGPYLCYAASSGYMSERLRQLGKLTQGKAFYGRTLPLNISACREEDSASVLPHIIFRFSPERYHLLLTIDENGSIKRILTEDEMVRLLLQDGKD